MRNAPSRDKSPRRAVGLGLLLANLVVPSLTRAQEPSPTLLVPELGVRTLVSGLGLPTSVAFLGPNDLLVLEKNTGRVVRVTNGVAQGAVLDLGVNFASERGLLGIALHPDFPATPQVFLFWTCRSTTTPANPFVPDEVVGNPANFFAPDTDGILDVPLLGNRVDRFTWNGSALTFDRNLISLRAFQNDAAPTPPGQGDLEQPARGNHNGGVIEFGPDGMLYVYFGDQGRRGQLQNLPSGPTSTGLGPTVADDQFGGPEPDNAHLSGVVLRLDPDGNAPSDNPFFEAGAAMGGEVGANVQKIFAYGFRNSFGMAFDPLSGRLWEADHGEDAFDEINRVEAGMNGGWIQVQGPLSRLSEYRQIETTSLNNEAFPNLQQLRWGPENIALSAREVRQRLFMLPGARYRDPALSFKHVVPPAGLGFVRGTGLGDEYEGSMFWGVAIPIEGGALFRARLNGGRSRIQPDDRRLRDGVVDNVTFNDLTETESLLIGRDFGVVTDIETGPNGNLYVVSLSRGSVFEIFRNPGARTANDSRGGRASTLEHAMPVVADRAGSISYVLSETGRVHLGVYDVQGRRVATLVDGSAGAGRGTISWDGTDRDGRAVAAGVYFVRLDVTGASGTRMQESRKMIVIR